MARICISSPRTMPTSSYRPSSGRRNSLTTYTDYGSSYTAGTSSNSRNPTTSVRTGAMAGSYNNAASRFDTTSSTYGSYSKPPPYRSRITSPSPARTTYGTGTSTSSHTSTRPLPHGPGPRDAHGNKITASEARSTFRSTSRSRINTPVRNGPMKADHNSSYHSTNGYSSTSTNSSTNYNPSNYANTSHVSPRLAREKRTNSISDLSSSVESLTMTTSNRRSLANSKKYGSTADINGNVDNYTYVKDIQPSTSKKTTHTTVITNHHASNDTPLPDINDRPNSSSSRSPSIDRTSRNNAYNNNFTVNIHVFSKLQ